MFTGSSKPTDSTVVLLQLPLIPAVFLDVIPRPGKHYRIDFCFQERKTISASWMHKDLGSPSLPLCTN